MFTGIVQEIGEIRRSMPREGAAGASDRRIEVSFGQIARDRLALGASISVDGVCLTVAELGNEVFFADVSGETLRVTTLGAKTEGARVNLEASLRAGDSLGGHWVSGHVDGLAQVLGASSDARSLRVELSAPKPLARYIARKGSVTLDGVSLTVNEVEGANFSINEIDLLARYVERLNTEPA
jgi:riboflavin synthase